MNCPTRMMTEPALQPENETVADLNSNNPNQSSSPPSDLSEEDGCDFEETFSQNSKMEKVLVRSCMNCFKAHHRFENLEFFIEISP